MSYDTPEWAACHVFSPAIVQWGDITFQGMDDQELIEAIDEYWNAEDDIIPDRQAQPQIGEYCILRGGHELSTDDEGNFHVFFQPYPSFTRDDWEPNLNEMLAGCIVSCHIEKIVYHHEEFVVLLVYVEDMTPTPELVERYVGTGEFLPEHMNYLHFYYGYPDGPGGQNRLLRQESGDYLLLTAGEYMDTGDWLLCRYDHSRECYRSLLYGVWELNDTDLLYVVVADLDPDFIGRLLEISEVAD